MCIRDRILNKTNAIRTSQGLEELLQDDEMDVLASLHSGNMITYDFFDHVDHEGKSPSERADDLDFVAFPKDCPIPVCWNVSCTAL